MEQVRQAAQQVLNTCADDDLFRRAVHAAVHRQIFGDLRPQRRVALHLAAL